MGEHPHVHPSSGGALTLATNPKSPHSPIQTLVVVALAQVDPDQRKTAGKLVAHLIIESAVSVAAAGSLAGVYTQVSSLTSSDLVSHFLTATGFWAGVSLIALATLVAIAVLIRCLAGLVRNAVALAFRTLRLVLTRGDELVLLSIVTVATLMLAALIANPTGNTLSAEEMLHLFGWPLLFLVECTCVLTCLIMVMWIAGAIASTVIRAGAHFAPSLAMIFLGLSIVAPWAIHSTAMKCGCVWGFGVENTLETCGPQPAADGCFRVCTLVNGPHSVSSRFYRACLDEHEMRKEEEEEEERREKEKLRKDKNGKEEQESAAKNKKREAEKTQREVEEKEKSAQFRVEEEKRIRELVIQNTQTPPLRPSERPDKE